MEGVLFYVTMLINKKSKKIFTFVRISSILIGIKRGIRLKNNHNFPTKFVP